MIFGALGRALGGLLGDLGAQKGPKWGSEGSPKREKSGLQRASASRSVFGAIFRRKICLFHIFFFMFFQCIVWPMEEGNA